MTRLPVTEADLHAYVDHVLPAERFTDVEAYLSAHPEDAARAAAYRQQNEGLHRTFDAMLVEPVPQRLTTHATSRWLGYAAVASWLVLGGVGGWYLREFSADRSIDSSTWVHRAAIAHVTYSPEVRHPVEVGADQETHLVNWLSKRLGTKLKTPHLGALGYSLVGGRLLPGDHGPVAQFMYQDGKGQRLTLYVRTNTDDSHETAFRFAQENNVGVFYWLDGRCGYALSGEIDKAELLRVATAVYRQLNP